MHGDTRKKDRYGQPALTPPQLATAREFRLQEFGDLTCPSGCPMRERKFRTKGGIHRCDRCGERYTISGVWHCLDDRARWAVHRITAVHLQQLEALGEPTTLAKVLTVLGLD